MVSSLIPTLALLYLPVLKYEQVTYWPEAPKVEWLAGQVEKETCITLKHGKCWNPRAELKTDREYGFGLGQLTVTPKFNNFEESKKWDKGLADWKWEDRYNPNYQLRALVVYMRNLNRSVKSVPDTTEKYAMTLSAYNGGMGGLLKDRLLCGNTSECDSTKWFNQVENTSFKSKLAVKGYGQSFFAINRGYVRSIMLERYKKYEGVI
jgi:hypothetical protein